MLREANFARFFLGYLASLLGTSMASVAVAFAVLDSGGTATELGYVFAAGIVPQVLFMLGGGVVADRFGRRPTMLTADAARCAAQALLAADMLATRPPAWVFAVFAALRGAGDAFFTPALGGLTPEVASASAAQLGNANALLSAARAGAAVAGPALAGVLIATTSPALVIALDAASYAVSGLALTRLRLRRMPPGTAQSLLADLRDGWAEFRSRSWLVITTVQFTLFNLLTWGPFLLLGPVLCQAYLGGARAWGTVLACYGGRLLALGRRPRRPVAAATVATFGYGTPGALLALHAPLLGVAAGALTAGIGSALGGALGTTAEQQQLPSAALARVTAIQTVSAFALGPLSFAAAGPVAAVLGARAVLGFGAVWCTLSTAAVLALPAVRAVGVTSQRDSPATPG